MFTIAKPSSNQVNDPLEDKNQFLTPAIKKYILCASI
jgi:hypothetical protein